MFYFCTSETVKFPLFFPTPPFAMFSLQKQFTPTRTLNLTTILIPILLPILNPILTLSRSLTLILTLTTGKVSLWNLK